VACDPFALIAEYYRPGSRGHAILVDHVRRVADKARAVAEGLPHALGVDLVFVTEAALLHDIGICRTAAPGLECRGAAPYICHGVIGRALLEAHGLPRHGLVCERHVGAGIAAHEIRDRGLPLPGRDMLPLTLEEQLVCFADKFYSKNGAGNGREKPLPQVLAEMAAYGAEPLARFRGWLRRFMPGKDQA
jgi:uncharacterized protein